MLDTSLDIALDFLRAHPKWFIFPITRLEKDPPLIKDNLNQASNDPAVIKQWHTKWRGCNWGVSPRKSGLIIMDVDTKPGKVGQATLDNLILEFGDLPETYTVQSPSGGLHYYFSGVHRFGLGKYGFGPDIDSPNYVLIPGCWVCNNSERGYSILNDADVAPAPTWFGEFLKEKTAEAAPEEAATDLDKPENIARMVLYLQEGAPVCRQGANGNKTLYDVACVLKDNGISEGMTVKLLATWYNVEGKCEPLWSVGVGPDADRLDIVVRNAFRYSAENQAGSATAEFAFGDPTDKITAEDMRDMVKAWDKRLATQASTKEKKRYERLFTDEARGIDPLTGEPFEDETVVDPLTGEPFDDPPPSGGATPPKAGASEDASGSDGPKADDSFNGTPKAKQTLKWVRANWVWIVSMERFMRLADGVMWSKQQFDSYYNNLTSKSSVSGALFSTDSVRKVERVVYRPGKGVWLDNNRVVNLWRPSRIKPKEGDTTIWNEHLNYLFQDPTERDHVLNWMAWVYQNQEKKPNHGLLIVGRNTGTGKSFIARVLEQLVGIDNTQRPKNSSLKGDFNAWALQCKLCIIEELMQIGRREVANELRDTITESTIEVNIKNVNAQKVENYMAMMAITNHRDAMPMEDTERRWLVVETFVTKKLDGAYYDRLFSILTDDDALAAIAHELKVRDLKGYNAQLSPQETDARAQMISLSRSDAETWLYDRVESYPFTRTLVTIQEVMEAMPSVIQRQARLNSLIRTFIRDRVKGEPFPRAVRVGLGTGKDRIRLWALNGKLPLLLNMTDAQIADKWKAERDQRAPPEEEAAEDFGE